VCAEKLLLVGVMVFFWPQTLSQLAAAQCVAMVFLTLYAHVTPFVEYSVSLMAIGAQLCIALIVLAGILIFSTEQFDSAGVDDAYDSGRIGIILIGLLILPCAITVGMFVFDVYQRILERRKKQAEKAEKEKTDIEQGAGNKAAAPGFIQKKNSKKVSSVELLA